jgi:3-mercaptopropionate dioxygenase
MQNYSRFRQFIGDFTRLIERAGNDEAAIFEHGGKLLKSLVGTDDWLPDVRAALTV